MVITKREDVTKQGFCKTLWRKLRLRGSLKLVLIPFWGGGSGKGVGAYLSLSGSGREVGAYSNKYGISITHFTISERILTRWTFYDVISMVHESVDHEKLWWVCLIDLIHDTRNLWTHLKADGIRASHVVSQSANKRKNCHCKKWRSSLFIIDKRKWRTFHLKDNNGKLWVKRIFVTFLGCSSDRRCPHSKQWRPFDSTTRTTTTTRFDLKFLHFFEIIDTPESFMVHTWSVQFFLPVKKEGRRLNNERITSGLFERSWREGA